MISLLRSSLRLGVALAVVGLAGCNEDVPSTSANGTVFTLWGQLDPSTRRQAIRVEPIAPTIEGIEDIDATVASVSLTTGEETAWRDSVVTFPDGSVGHIFLADYQPAYGDLVEFRVLRGGEVATYARVRIPPQVSGYFGDPVIGARSTVDLVLPGAPRAVGARVIYNLASGDTGFQETIDIDDADIRSIDFGWRVTVDFTRQVQVLRSRLNQENVGEFAAEVIQVQVAVANEEWAAPYPFPFSRSFLIQPGTVSNVRNGFGFLGAAYVVDVAWDVDEEVLRRLGL